MSANLRLTDRQLAVMFNVSLRMLALTRAVQRRACPELLAAITAGDISMHLADQIARFNHATQRLILAELPAMRARERTAFVRRLVEKFQGGAS